MKVNMLRQEWFSFVKKTRVKMQRKDKSKNITHQMAMKEASKNWATEKSKIERRIKREEKKRAKQNKEEVEKSEQNAEKK